MLCTVIDKDIVLIQVLCVFVIESAQWEVLQQSDASFGNFFVFLLFLGKGFLLKNVIIAFSYDDFVNNGLKHIIIHCLLIFFIIARPSEEVR